MALSKRTSSDLYFRFSQIFFGDIAPALASARELLLNFSPSIIHTQKQRSTIFPARFMKEKKMLRRIILASIVPGFFSLWLSSFVLASMAVHIGGVVKDAQTGDPLPGANILFLGTGFGASTDINGTYTVQGVPSGSYTIRATYIGYNPKEIVVRIEEGVEVKQDFKLEAVGVQGEAVVITAQAVGQNQAINRQLTAPTIVNVVSAARIQELPDANAAESIGRLPGVSIIRNGGEGTQVVIRGLQPKYNNVTVDGVRMASSNPNDRSADLSMISPNMLEGIAYYKSLIPNFVQETEAYREAMGRQLQALEEELRNIIVPTPA